MEHSGLEQWISHLSCVLDSFGGLVKHSLLGYMPGDLESGMRPENLIYNKFHMLLMLLILGLYFENHWVRMWFLVSDESKYILVLLRGSWVTVGKSLVCSESQFLHL